MNRFISEAITWPSGCGFLSSKRTARLAGSKTPRATTAMTATTIIEATIQPWLGEVLRMLPDSLASCQPATRVQVTTVGMMSSILGISRVVTSTRAGIERRPRIGPSTNPRKRSSAVQKPPPTTWKKSTAQLALVPTATANPTRATPTMGRPPRGTMSNSGRIRPGGAPVAPAGGPASCCVMTPSSSCWRYCSGQTRGPLRSVVARSEDAELVALRVAQHLPAVARVDVLGGLGADGHGLPDGGLVIGGSDVDVQAVLHRFPLRHPQEEQGQGLGVEDHVTVPVDLHVAADQPAPPAGERLGLDAVDADPPHLRLEGRHLVGHGASLTDGRALRTSADATVARR